MSELQERLAYVEEERGLLLRQKETLTDELEACLKDRAETDRKLFAAEAENKELHFARAYLDEVMSEKGQSEATVLQQAADLSASEARGRAQAESTYQLRDELDACRRELTAAEAGRAAAAAALEEQSEVLTAKIQTFAARIRDLQTKVVAATNKSEAAEAAGRTMRRELEQMRADNQGMLVLMGSMERQLADFASREERTEVVARECRASAETALLERDAAVAAEGYLRTELGRLREVRVKEFEERAASHEEALAAAAEQARRVAAAREVAMERFVAENESLRASAEVAGRERDASEARFSQLAATLDTERRMIKERCRSLEERVSQAEGREAATRAELEQAKAENRGEASRLERAGREVARAAAEAEDLRQKVEAEASTADEALQGERTLRERAERTVSQLTSERDALVSRVQRLAASEVEAASREAAGEEAKRRSRELEVRLEDLAASAEAQRERQRKDVELLRADKDRQEGILEDALRCERESQKASAQAYHELLVRCSESEAEVAGMRAGFDEAVRRADAAEASASDTAERITELSIAVAEAGAKEQAHLREHARLKSEVARLRFAPGQSIENPIQP